MTSYLTELRCAEALARAAGKMMQRGVRDGFEVSIKGENDLVTNIDREIEQFLRAEIAEMFPDDGVFGEEYGASGDSPRQWLVDPIDGTTNFSQGIPVYCVSIALQVDGRSEVAVIYEPSRQELFSARRGHGATLNGRPMRVSEREEARRAVMVTGFPPIKQGEGFETIVKRMIAMVGGTRAVRRMGSAALDLAYVACGRFDGFWEYGLNPWDTAAGYLLVEEAGGRVTDTHGNMFTAHEPSVLATNGPLHQGAVQALSELTKKANG